MSFKRLLLILNAISYKILRYGMHILIYLLQLQQQKHAYIYVYKCAINRLDVKIHFFFVFENLFISKFSQNFRARIASIIEIIASDYKFSQIFIFFYVPHGNAQFACKSINMQMPIHMYMCMWVCVYGKQMTYQSNYF